MDYKTLLKKRGTCKAKLTQFKSYLEIVTSCDTLSTLQISELKIRLSKIEELYHDYDSIQSDLENVSDIPEDQYKERETYETHYYAAIAAAQELLSKQETSAGTGSVTGDSTVSGNKGGIKLKLPTIHLPTFSGQYHNWLEFHDTYLSLIHLNDTIPRISKFHYLRAALKDSAALIISSLDFSDENYDVAWQLLCDRYNNRRLLVYNHVQAIINIEHGTQESFKVLRNIIDTVNRNIRALKTLKLPTDGWDVLIIHLVSSKLDSVTSREWETYRNALDDLATLADFNKFLKNRADLLETIAEVHNNGLKGRHSGNTHKQGDSTHKQKTFTVNSESSNNNKPYSCPLCKGNHAIYQCSSFKSLSIEARIQKARSLNLCLNCLRNGHKSFKCRMGGCSHCRKRHNTMLHLNGPSSTQDTNNGSTDSQPTSTQPTANASSVVLCTAQSNTQLSTSSQDNVVLSATHNSQCVILLSTATINVTDHNGHKHRVRALLDNGSTSSFITKSLCDKLKIPTRSTSTLVEGLNRQSSCIFKRCDVVISSLINSYSESIHCLVVPHITQALPCKQVNHKGLDIPPNITLADPLFHTPSQVDMLLGADLFWSVLLNNNISLGKNKPTLSETKFGWLISGPTHSLQHNIDTVHCNHLSTHYDDQLQDQLTKFFELETVTVHKPVSKEEQECESNFIQTTTRENDGRFIVTIPLKESPQKLGSSYEQALSRFISLERRFKRDPLFKKQYAEFIKEYISLGHMTENTTPDKDEYTYIMPHHGVLRETSLTTKLRVVFDASAVTSSGLSFNNIQMVGPTVQSDLISILIRFRQFKYVVTADVEKMYRMVKVTESQHMLQQILWRFEPNEQLRQYKLNTVTYGTASAPYLATRCLVQLGKECTDKSVSDAIIKGFYVDDFIYGDNDMSKLVDICRGVINQLESGQLSLRKWNSNNSSIIQQLIGENSKDELLNLSNHEYSKTLGLLWGCKEDVLLFSANIKQHEHITKRTILSTMAQIFDPLGLINPCILQAKIILQKLWSLKITWDENVSSEIQASWCNFIKTLADIRKIRIPRHVTCDYPVICELHAFSDASTQAYSACIYLRSVSQNNEVTVKLVTAKSRVAPLKPMTVPRLELSGALLAARLADKVKSSLIGVHSCTYWCDSTIVLAWINTSKTNLLKPFVYNRIHELKSLTKSGTWRYVPTRSNPADIGSRGADARHLESNSLWWSGPAFLTELESNWPGPPTNIKEDDLPEFKVQSHLNISEQQSVEFVNRFSEFSKLQRITAYILRFIRNCRSPQNKYIGFLTLHELNGSLITLCRISQHESFHQECTLLKNKQQLPLKNKLTNLNPFLHSDGLIRVGGRLSNSHYRYDTKHPILLHASNHITVLIFRFYHKLLMHAGPQLLLSNIRHKFWALNGRNLSRKTVHNCVTCCRFSGRITQPIMGNLPEQRLHADYPFINTAVDYAGPVMILNRKGRGSHLIKAYICIFVCLAIRAVHIELVTDLSSETFISALNRFIARRGKPVNIFSDNGTCFVGACNELARFLKLNANYLSAHASNLSINFKFSPAYSPHFNGLAEGAVKSVKHHLKRILALANLTYEEMNTVLTQIEAILNSRPLTPLSTDPSDLVALTPSHFLLGRTLTVLPSPQAQDTTRLSTFSRYMRTQQLKTHFWDRFYKEYITELQKRQKWCKGGRDLRLGEMVLVKDDRLPPNRWLLGRVTSVYPGSDGVTRVADVKTTSGTLRRAFNRLCPLPVEDRPDVSTSHSPVPRGATC